MEYQAPTVYQMNANGTHIPILSALVLKTEGPIVELGAGHYSTPLLHFLCKNNKRTVVSVDTSRVWNEFFETRFKSDNHKYYCTNNKLISVDFLRKSEWKDTVWAVAFIDCGPDADRRRCVEALRNKAKYIIVHDAEPEAKVYGWDGVFDTFPNRFCWSLYGNSTEVVSMTEDCSWLS